MTITKTTPLLPIGLTHIDCEPIWVKEEIVLFDMYLKDGTWIGSRRLLEYCEKENDYYRRRDIKG